MRKYRLSKLYILKIIILRFFSLQIINILYVSFNHFIPYRFSFIILLALKIINIFGAFIIFVLPIVEYFAYNYEISEEYIEINYGVIFRNHVYIPMKNIKYAIITRDPIDYCLGLSKINIYTPARRRAIRCLSYSMAKDVCKTIRLKSMVNEK